MEYSNTAKVVIRGKFIAFSAYINILQRQEINDLTVQLKDLQKQNKANPKFVERNNQGYISKIEKT